MSKSLFKLILILGLNSVVFGQLSFDPTSINFGPITVNTEASLTVSLGSEVDNTESFVTFSGLDGTPFIFLQILCFILLLENCRIFQFIL